MMLGPPSASAAQQCAEVESAKAALRTNGPQAGARSQDVQSPRSNQDVQAPRSQDIQAPRQRDVQSPRTQQDVQSPRSQDIQSPRNQDVQSPRGQQPAPQSAQRQQATQLVNEAAAACDAGNPTVASQKAREAMALLADRRRRGVVVLTAGAGSGILRWTPRGGAAR